MVKLNDYNFSQMDEEYERIEKVVGNQHKYQYMTLFISMMVFFSTSYIDVSEPYFLKRPVVTYFNETSQETIESRLTYEICEEYKPEVGRQQHCNQIGHAVCTTHLNNKDPLCLFDPLCLHCDVGLVCI